MKPSIDEGLSLICDPRQRQILDPIVKNRSKIVSWVAAMLAVVAGLAACGGGDPETPSQVSLGTASSQSKPATNDADKLAALRQGDAPGPRFPESLEGLEAGRTFAAQPLKSAKAAVDGGYAVDTENREAVRLFYKSVYASSDGVASQWTGNIATCDAGDTSSDYRAATLRRINWFRAMAGVPASIQFDATFNAKAQQAAMLNSANNQLNHFPPSTWRCYNAVAAEAAGKSNLAVGHSGADAVASGYMGEPGASNAPVGHRRWVLYPQTRVMGTGDIRDTMAAQTPQTNALWVQDANIFSPRPAVRDDFVAWPPKGYAPYTTVFPRWSFSYPKADFSAATVTMTENGSPIATRKESVANGFGENTLVWLPGSYADGMTWAKPASDMVYEVQVSNVVIDGKARNFTYRTTVFDPDQDPVAAMPQTIVGNGGAVVGQSSAYTFNPVAGATDYQWRTLTTVPYVLDDSAESGAAAFSSATSAGYSVIEADVSASGSNSFHLAHTQPVDQTLQLKATLVGTPNAVLTFKSRLGLSSPAQIARVEASLDDGKNWISLFQQAGQQSGVTSTFGEPNFSSKQISLAQFVDKTFLLRFRYEKLSGSFYSQASAGIGWYLDDVHLGGVDSIVSSGAAITIASNGFAFLPAMSGAVFLQMHTGMYGYYSDWSNLKRINVSGPGVPIGQLFAGGPGDETFTGGPATDTVQYVGSWVNYQVRKSASGFTVRDTTGNRGSDTVINIERLKFSDRGIALDVGASQPAGQTQLLLGAVLGKNLLATKQPLIGTVIGLFDTGQYTMQDLSGAIMRLPIWGLLANGGNETASNTQIANYLLTTVNGVVPDSAALAAGVSSLNSETGAAEGNFLRNLAESAANQAQVGLAGLATTGLVFGF